MKRYFILICLGWIFLAVVCIQAVMQTTEKDWIDKGNDLYAQGNYTEAIKAYDKSVEVPDGGNVTAAYLMKTDAFLEEAMRNNYYILTVKEFLNKSKNDANWIIVDLRQPEEYRENHIKGAINIPLPDLISNMKNIPAGKKVAVYCVGDQRARYAVMALRIFDDRDAWVLSRGVSAWKEADQPIELPFGPT